MSAGARPLRVWLLVATTQAVSACSLLVPFGDFRIVADAPEDATVASDVNDASDGSDLSDVDDLSDLSDVDDVGDVRDVTSEDTGPIAVIDVPAADVALCSGTQRLCSGACVDTSSSALHCGSCANACAAGTRCVTGVCRACQTDGFVCAATTICCAPLTCGNLLGRSGSYVGCCAPPGAACTTTTRCCDRMACTAGRCA